MRVPSSLPVFLLSLLSLLLLSFSLPSLSNAQALSDDIEMVDVWNPDVETELKVSREALPGLMKESFVLEQSREFMAGSSTGMAAWTSSGMFESSSQSFDSSSSVPFESSPEFSSSASSSGPSEESSSPLFESSSQFESSGFGSSSGAGFESSDEGSSGGSSGGNGGEPSVEPPTGAAIVSFGIDGFFRGLSAPTPSDVFQPYDDDSTNFDLLYYTYYLQLSGGFIYNRVADDAKMVSFTAVWTNIDDASQQLTYSDANMADHLSSGSYRAQWSIPAQTPSGVYELTSLTLVTTAETLQFSSAEEIQDYVAESDAFLFAVRLHMEYDNYPSQRCFAASAAIDSLCGTSLRDHQFPGQCSIRCAVNSSQPLLNFFSFYEECLDEFTLSQSNPQAALSLYNDCEKNRLPSYYYRDATCGQKEARAESKCSLMPGWFVYPDECSQDCLPLMSNWVYDCVNGTLPRTNSFFQPIYGQYQTCLTTHVALDAPEPFTATPLVDTDGTGVEFEWVIPLDEPSTPLLDFELHIYEDEEEMPFFSTRLLPNVTSISLFNFVPFTPYTAILIANNGYPYPHPARSSFITLPERARPVPDFNMTLVEDNPRNRIFTWELLTELPAGTTAVDHYVIFVKPTEPANWEPFEFWTLGDEDMFAWFGIFPSTAYNVTLFAYTNSGYSEPYPTKISFSVPVEEPAPLEDFFLRELADENEIVYGFRCTWSTLYDAFSDPEIDLPLQQIKEYRVYLYTWVNESYVTTTVYPVTTVAPEFELNEFILNTTSGLEVGVDYAVQAVAVNFGGLESFMSQPEFFVIEPEKTFNSTAHVMLKVRSTSVSLDINSDVDMLHAAYFIYESGDSQDIEHFAEVAESIHFLFDQAIPAQSSYDVLYAAFIRYFTTGRFYEKWAFAAFEHYEGSTRPAAPVIASANGSDPLGKDAMISVTFSAPVTQSDLSTLFTDNLIHFVPAIPLNSNMSASWLSETQMMLSLANSRPLPEIGAFISFDESLGLESSTGSDIITGPVPLAGSFQAIDPMPANLDYVFRNFDRDVLIPIELSEAFIMSQHPSFVGINFRLNLVPEFGTLSETFLLGTTSTLLRDVTLNLAGVKLRNRARSCKISLILLDAADNSEFSRAAYLVNFNSVNNRPTITTISTPIATPARVWSNLTGSFPPLVVDDVDYDWNPRARMSMQITSDAAQFMYNDRIYNRVMPFAGTMDAINAALAGIQIMIEPFPDPVRVTIIVNDQANGASSRARASASRPRSVTSVLTHLSDCSSMSNTDLIRSISISPSGQQVNIQFSTPVTIRNMTDTPCFELFDTGDNLPSDVFGRKAHCFARTPTSYSINLGKGSTFPKDLFTLRSNVVPACMMFNGNSSTWAMRRLLQTVQVTTPSAPASPTVTLTGPATMTMCQSLTITAAATNLAGKATTYNWDHDVPGLNLLTSWSSTPGTLTIPGNSITRTGSFKFSVIVINYLDATSNKAEFPVTVSSLAYPSVTFSGGAVRIVNLATATSSYSLGISVATPTCTNALVPANQSLITTAWSVSPMDFNGDITPFLTATTGVTLTFPTALFKPGTAYTFSATVFVVADRRINSTASTIVTANRGVLTATIQGSVGGDSVVSPSAGLTLKASINDPNNAGAGYSYNWTCSTVSSTGATVRCTSPQSPARTESTWSIASLTPGATFFFDLVVTPTDANDARQATANRITVRTQNNLPFTVAVFGPRRVTPSDRMTLLATIQGGSSSNANYTYAWSVDCPSNPADSQLASLRSLLAAVPRTLRSAVLNPNRVAGFFTPGATYEFIAAVTDNVLSQTSTTRLRVSVINEPANGDFTIAFNGPFVQSTLTATSWESVSGSSLEYRFYYINPLVRFFNRIYLNRASSIPIARVFLPLGFGPQSQLVIGLEVIDPVRGATTSVELTQESRLATNSPFFTGILNTGFYTAAFNYDAFTDRIRSLTSDSVNLQNFQPLMQFTTAVMLAEIQYLRSNVSVLNTTSNAVSVISWTRFNCEFAGPLSAHYLRVRAFYQRLTISLNTVFPNNNVIKLRSMEQLATMIQNAYGLSALMKAFITAKPTSMPANIQSSFQDAYSSYLNEYFRFFQSTPTFTYNAFEDSISDVNWDAVEREQLRAKASATYALNVLSNCTVVSLVLPTSCSAAGRRLLASPAVQTRADIERVYESRRALLEFASNITLQVPGDATALTDNTIFFDQLTRASQATTYSQAAAAGLSFTVRYLGVIAQPGNPGTYDVRMFYAPVNQITWPAAITYTNNLITPTPPSRNGAIISPSLSVEILRLGYPINDIRASDYAVSIQFTIAKSGCVSDSIFSCAPMCFRHDGNNSYISAGVQTNFTDLDASNWRVTCQSDSGLNLPVNTFVVQSSFIAIPPGSGSSSASGSSGASGATGTGSGASGASSSSGSNPVPVPPADAGSSSSLGAIIGGVVGGIGAIAVVVGVVFYMKRKQATGKIVGDDGLTPAQRAAAAAAASAHAGAQAHTDPAQDGGAAGMFLPHSGDGGVEPEGTRFTFQPVAGSDAAAAAGADDHEEGTRFTFQTMKPSEPDVEEAPTRFTFQPMAAPVAQPVADAHEEGTRFTFQPSQPQAAPVAEPVAEEEQGLRFSFQPR